MGFCLRTEVFHSEAAAGIADEVRLLRQESVSEQPPAAPPLSHDTPQLSHDTPQLSHDTPQLSHDTQQVS